jgi:hypothetical protein
VVAPGAPLQVGARTLLLLTALTATGCASDDESRREDRATSSKVPAVRALRQHSLRRLPATELAEGELFRVAGVSRRGLFRSTVAVPPESPLWVDVDVDERVSAPADAEDCPPPCGVGTAPHPGVAELAFWFALGDLHRRGASGEAAHVADLFRDFGDGRTSSRSSAVRDAIAYRLHAQDAYCRDAFRVYTEEAVAGANPAEEAARHLLRQEGKSWAERERVDGDARAATTGALLFEQHVDADGVYVLTAYVAASAGLYQGAERYAERTVRCRAAAPLFAEHIEAFEAVITASNAQWNVVLTPRAP